MIPRNSAEYKTGWEAKVFLDFPIPISPICFNSGEEGGSAISVQLLAARRPRSKRKIWGTAISILTLLFLAACQHTPDVLPEPEEFTQIYDANEKIILRAVAQVFQSRNFGKAKVDEEKNHLETAYVVQGEWRTKAVATVKKIGRKERELTLSVITEKKSSSGWEVRRVLEKEQYDQIFSDIEMQIYREYDKTY